MSSLALDERNTIDRFDLPQPPAGATSDTRERDTLASVHDYRTFDDSVVGMVASIMNDAVPQVGGDTGVVHGSIQHQETVGTFLAPIVLQPVSDETLLPMHNVGRAVTDHISSGGKVANDTKSHVQDCVSEFMAVVITEAADAMQEKPSTSRIITPSHLRSAIESLGLNFMLPALDILVANSQVHDSPNVSAKRARGE